MWCLSTKDGSRKRFPSDKQSTVIGTSRTFSPKPAELALPRCAPCSWCAPLLCPSRYTRWPFPWSWFPFWTWPPQSSHSGGSWTGYQIMLEQETDGWEGPEVITAQLKEFSVQQRKEYLVPKMSLALAKRRSWECLQEAASIICNYTLSKQSLRGRPIVLQTHCCRGGMMKDWWH